MPWHAKRPPGTSGGANEVGHGLGCRVCSAQEPGWLVECLRLGVGMPAPSGQIRPPWAWWENEAPTTRAACRPSQASNGEGCVAVSRLRFARSPTASVKSSIRHLLHIAYIRSAEFA